MGIFGSKQDKELVKYNKHVAKLKTTLKKLEKQTTAHSIILRGIILDAKQLYEIKTEKGEEITEEYLKTLEIEKLIEYTYQIIRNMETIQPEEVKK